MENELKSYISNVDEVISLLKQKVERIEKERDEWKVKYDELCERYKALDQAMFQLQQQLKDMTGARWVKDKPPLIHGDYYCRCKVDGEVKKLIVEFDKNGKWGEATGHDYYEDFEIIEWLDESAAGREDAMDDKRQRIMGTISFAEEVLIWAEKNGYTWKDFAYWKEGVKHPLREIYNKVYVEKRAGEMLPNVVQTVKEAEEFLNELKVKTKQQKEK